MTPELPDESVLTAYLDDELDPERRSSIASALLSDPELAEQLRTLAEVRALVAGLSRPVLTVDLSPAILGRIAGIPAPVRPGRRRLARAAGGLALAATVLLAVSLALHARRPSRAPSPPTNVGEAETLLAATPSPEPSRSRPGPPETQVVSQKVVADNNPPSREDAAADRGRDENVIREMLDSPHLRRIFIVTDVLGGDGLDRVEGLVRTTPRTEARFGRITVTQGIVIDPRHPNKATVFALAMNEQELEIFQKKLEQDFPERVEDAGADPAVVSQLTEIGQVAVLPGTRASVVVIPRDVSPRVALRTDTSQQQAVLEKSRVSSSFGMPDLAGAAGNTAREKPAPPTSLAENADVPENTPRQRAAGGGERSPLARREDLPLAAVADEKGGVEAGERHADADASVPLADMLSRAQALHEPSAIVLVWVTSH